MLPIILVLICLFQTTRAGTPKNYEDADAYRIYSVVLRSDPLRLHDVKRLVILNETRSRQMCRQPEGEFQETVGPAIKDYLLVNASPWLLQQNFDTDLSYELVSNEQLLSVLGNHQWDIFEARYPESRGWVAFSAVGFNQDRTVAVVHVSHHCGDLCGMAGFQVLKRKNDAWIPVEFDGWGCRVIS